MIHEASAMTVRQNLGELLNEVQYRQDSVLGAYFSRKRIFRFLLK